ncbi:hypothetical protein NDU88_004270 [Pleurodeles waltl]|uniref:Uncharacterized protein n=1 Tax=Pleurodeles waltl TaxID=8319 RepID=A0AAV7T7M7_PLEWA|nr:hypothetical protein NDU88_004270 [Pleurodeles waltl]
MSLFVPAHLHFRWASQPGSVLRESGGSPHFYLPCCRSLTSGSFHSSPAPFRAVDPTAHSDACGRHPSGGRLALPCCPGTPPAAPTLGLWAQPGLPHVSAGSLPRSRSRQTSVVRPRPMPLGPPRGLALTPEPTGATQRSQSSLTLFALWLPP